MSEPLVERCAKALWDFKQERDRLFNSWSNAMWFGEEWRGKLVPWEHLTGPHVVESAAEREREEARVVLKAAGIEL